MLSASRKRTVFLFYFTRSILKWVENGRARFHIRERTNSLLGKVVEIFCRFPPLCLPAIFHPDDKLDFFGHGGRAFIIRPPAGSVCAWTAHDPDRISYRMSDRVIRNCLRSRRVRSIVIRIDDNSRSNSRRRFVSSILLSWIITLEIVCIYIMTSTFFI